MTIFLIHTTAEVMIGRVEEISDYFPALAGLTIPLIGHKVTEVLMLEDIERNM